MIKILFLNYRKASYAVSDVGTDNCLIIQGKWLDFFPYTWDSAKFKIIFKNILSPYLLEGNYMYKVMADKTWKSAF